MKRFTNLAIGLVPVFTLACAVTPHVFQHQWTPEKLPEATIVGNNSVTGSGFLRQKGGGIVTCAGEDVVLERKVVIPRSAYAREVNSLNQYVRNASTVDSRHYDFERELQAFKHSLKLRSSCDVDGKFSFSNVGPGSYVLRTKVHWSVSQVADLTELGLGYVRYDDGQGGIVGAALQIPRESSARTFSIVLSELIQSCGASDSCVVD